MFNKTEKREKLQIANFNFVMGSLTMNASQPGIKIFPMLGRDRILKMMGEQKKTSLYHYILPLSMLISPQENHPLFLYKHHHLLQPCILQSLFKNEFN